MPEEMPDLDKYEVLLRTAIMSSGETLTASKRLLEESDKVANAAVVELRMHVVHLYDQLMITQELMARLLSELNGKLVQLADGTIAALEALKKSLDDLNR